MEESEKKTTTTPTRRLTRGLPVQKKYERMATRVASLFPATATKGHDAGSRRVVGYIQIAQTMNLDEYYVHTMNNEEKEQEIVSEQER